jgi:hypothetical protein
MGEKKLIKVQGKEGKDKGIRQKGLGGKQRKRKKGYN